MVFLRLIPPTLLLILLCAWMPSRALAAKPAAHVAQSCVTTPVPTANPGNPNPNIAAVNVLSAGDDYISPAVISAGHATPHDIIPLERATEKAQCESVPTKIGLLATYPRPKHSPEPTPNQAADRLRNYLDYSGVVILVSPHGLGVSSDLLTSSDIRAIKRKASAACASVSYTSCAVAVAHDAIPYVKETQSRANHDVAVFWAIAVVVFGVIIAILVLAARRNQQKVLERWREEVPQ